MLGRCRGDGSGGCVRRGSAAALGASDRRVRRTSDPSRSWSRSQVLLESLRSARPERPRGDDHAGHAAPQPLQRLRAERWWTAHPEILDEPIDAPIVVVGMMRSGTTLLQRVLASDPRLACAYGWEVGEPSPRLGLGPRRRSIRGSPTPRRARSRRARSPPSCSPSTPPTSTRRRRRSSSSPTPSCRTSPRPRATCPRYRSWVDTQDFAPAYRWLRRMLQLLQWQKRQRGEPVRPFVLKTPGAPRLPRRPCWPSSPTPTSCTPTATRST